MLPSGLESGYHWISYSQKGKLNLQNVGLNGFFPLCSYILEYLLEISYHGHPNNLFLMKYSYTQLQLQPGGALLPISSIL